MAPVLDAEMYSIWTTFVPTRVRDLRFLHLMSQVAMFLLLVSRSKGCTIPNGFQDLPREGLLMDSGMAAKPRMGSGRGPNPSRDLLLVMRGPHQKYLLKFPLKCY
jgi:hypothetical protein